MKNRGILTSHYAEKRTIDGMAKQIRGRQNFNTPWPTMDEAWPITFNKRRCTNHNAALRFTIPR
jgi:hypothetical protein